ncbi:S-layer homology domain-containing protein [Paenibacillus koleovorans]|uniref:S-layer homology domain-containing protein n=1 Tax=Paenibacillus koleovorans TaxID=121608 RepID=UPI000FD9F302|nr:S-layer homology domain-containing protein [Paenibacillus koleovorans]
MNKRIGSKRVVSLLLAASLGLSVFPVAGIGAAIAADQTAAAPNSTYKSYFNDKYERITDDNHVYQTATYHELDFLLGSEGTNVFLFGGAWSPETQAVVGYINEVAQAKGIKTVYNFDTRLDGNYPATDIADSANNPYSRRYVDLVNKYLTNVGGFLDGSATVEYSISITSGRAPDTVTNTFEGSAPKIEAPFLFVYNKDYKTGATGAPIISAVQGIDGLSSGGSATDSAAAIAAYKAKVGAAFDAVPAALKPDLAAPHSNNDYIVSSYNKFAGETIFGEADKDVVLDPVTYDELTSILQSEGTYVFLFGCSWCPNTRAIAKLVNQYAKQYNVTKVYNWDTKLDGGIGGTPDVPAGTDNANFLQIRATGHPFADRYVDLVNTYLPNIETLYEKASNNVSYKDANGVEQVANKLQVPYFFVYNKDHKDAQGKPAPILGHVELMYTWANIQPNYESAGKKGVNYNNYISALDNVLPSVKGITATQTAPAGLKGTAPKSADSKDGQITGLAAAGLEYKRAEDAAYQPVKGASLTGLSQGTYYFRYSATASSKASPFTTVDLNLEQAAPAGLTGAAATTAAVADGKIVGTSALLEYRPAGTDKFTAAKASETGGLAAGKYEVRAAAKYGYSAGPVSAVTVGVAQSAFADVAATAWYYPAVNALVAKKIASGTDDTHFSPDSSITRGQFIVLLLKAYGIAGEENAKDNFADAGSTYYTPYLAAAKKLGIAEGSEGNQFQPEREITREQLFTLLHRSLGKLNKLPAATTSTTVASFSDAAQISSYALEAFRVFVAGGVVQGSDGKLNPAGLSTRAEAAQVLYNLLP